MVELGKKQKLRVVRMKEFGVYLGEHEGNKAAVLPPKKQVSEGTKLGGELKVFIYKDSESRLTTTTEVPGLQVGEVAVLKVKEVEKIDVFLNMGLEEDLLLPSKEQNHKVRQGEDCLVTLYVDKNKRLATTIRVYSYMSSESPYQKDDKMTGAVYELDENPDASVTVDNRYYDLVPRKELYGNIHEGDIVTARVMKVRDDDKLDLNPREKAYVQMDTDSELVLKVIDEFDGVLPFTDKANPGTIKREFSMSRDAFKHAVGHLLKEGKIRITKKTIEGVQEVSLELDRIL